MIPLVLHAEVEFTVSMPPNPMATPLPAGKSAPEDEQSAKIAELKLLGVSQWLQGYLGDRYPQYQRWVTTDFSEKYVLDYKVGKAQDGATEISGHLDVDSLKRWVRLMDTKANGTTRLKVIYANSSSVPSIPFQASETSGRGRETAYGQISAGLVQNHFKGYNTAPAPVGSTCCSAHPPLPSKGVSVLSRFAGQTGNNVVLWTHLAPCAPCGGMRLDFYLYSAIGDRLVVVNSEDLKLSPADATNAERLGVVMNEAYQNFHKDLEDAV